MFNLANFGMVCHVSCGMDIHSDLQNDNEKGKKKLCPITMIFELISLKMFKLQFWLAFGRCSK